MAISFLPMALSTPGHPLLTGLRKLRRLARPISYPPVQDRPTGRSECKAYMSLSRRAYKATFKLLQAGSATGLAFIFSSALMSTSASSQPAQGSGPESGPLIDRGELSWSIDNRPLREVLQQLSGRLGFELTISAKLPAQTISGKFSSVPVDKALSDILTAQNYIIGRSAADEINHIYVFAEGETPKVAPRINASRGSTAKTEKQKLIDDLEALLPPGTLTQTMKDALLAGANAPSEAEIAEIRSRQSAIFEEFKARFDPLNQTTSGSGKN